MLPALPDTSICFKIASDAGSTACENFWPASVRMPPVIASFTRLLTSSPISVKTEDAVFISSCNFGPAAITDACTSKLCFIGSIASNWLFTLLPVISAFSCNCNAKSTAAPVAFSLDALSLMFSPTWDFKLACVISASC